jgi:hypothetical protein
MGADLLIPIFLGVAALAGVTFAVSFVPAFPKLPQLAHQLILLASGAVCVGSVIGAIWMARYK